VNKKNKPGSSFRGREERRQKPRKARKKKKGEKPVTNEATSKDKDERKTKEDMKEYPDRRNRFMRKSQSDTEKKDRSVKGEHQLTNTIH
jgi:hypothetical protein